jgi:hypothetical protein
MPIVSKKIPINIIINNNTIAKNKLVFLKVVSAKILIKIANIKVIIIILKIHKLFFFISAPFINNCVILTNVNSAT